MPNHASFLSIAALMFLTGVGIPIMATWNAVGIAVMGLGVYLARKTA